MNLFINSLFASDGSDHQIRNKCEKLKCIINYFRRVTTNMPNGVVSFERRYRRDQQLPDWHSSNKNLTNLTVFSDGVIETEGKGLLQVDFANQYIGGGVLRSGCVQEEIRFLICPELIASLLFTERMLDTEAVIITGCEQFSQYSGYASTFEYQDNFVDDTSIDEWGRRSTQVVAIDAIRFNHNKTDDQFKRHFFERELNKAYVGFECGQFDPNSAIATGNWGCGAFNGDLYLKAIIQIMAASQAKRDLLYFTFGDSQLKNDLEEFFQFSKSNHTCVSDLYKQVMSYHTDYQNTKFNLFEFIRNFN